MNTRELSRLTSPRRAAGEIRATGWRRPPASRRPARTARRPSEQPARYGRRGKRLHSASPSPRPKKSERKCGDRPLGGRRRARGERAHLSWPDLLPGTAVVRWSEGEGREGARRRAGPGGWGATVSETGRAWGARPAAGGGERRIYMDGTPMCLAPGLECQIAR